MKRQCSRSNSNAWLNKLFSLSLSKRQHEPYKRNTSFNNQERSIRSRTLLSRDFRWPSSRLTASKQRGIHHSVFGDSCGHHRPMKLNYFGHRPSKSPRFLVVTDFPLESTIFKGILWISRSDVREFTESIATFFEENKIDFSFDDKRDYLINSFAVHFSRVTVSTEFQREVTKT